MQENQFDIVINGAGMVGAALACGLAQHNFRVAVIDRQIPAEFDPQAQPDVRISALGCRSVELLQSLQVWPTVKSRRCAPYRKLETWEWKNSHTEFSAEMLGLPELGYMVENTVLQRALWERMLADKVTIFCPDQLVSMQQQEGHWQITLSQGQQLTCRLLVGADGANSQIRQKAGIGIRAWDYSQSCMLISVECENPPGDSTWQQFTPQGPRAFLPLYDNYASLVWYDSPARIRQLSQMRLEQLQQAIEQHFPSRLGKVTVLGSGAFPLTRRHAATYVQPGLALVGDAAHTINPLAGQGVNLGYRDIDKLLEVLIASRDNCQEWWSMSTLKDYQRQRYTDNLLMQSGMDVFHFAFSNDHKPLAILRNLGLMAAQRGGWLKRKALSYALGL